MKKNLLPISVIAIGLALGCSSDDGKKEIVAPDTLCEPGSKKCFGNVSGTCSDDGRSYSALACADIQICDGTTGACKTVQCQPIGKAKCKDGTSTQKKLNQCVGGSWKTKECLEGSVCAGAECRAIPCKPGEAKCLWGYIAMCNETGQGWTETKCSSGEVCGDCSEEGCQCVDEICTPNKNRCLNPETQLSCNADGTAWLDEAPCPEGETCYEQLGVCLPKLAEEPKPDVPDVVEPAKDVKNPDPPDEGKPEPVDEGPKVELEPLDLAECTVDGQLIKFQSNLSATYLEDEQDLRISMDKGLKKIELSIKPIEPGDIGEWSSEVAEDVQVFVYYNDGSDIGGAQWKYQSAEYALSLTKFQSPGGRVVGQFSGTFTADQGVTTVPFGQAPACTFDVKRHD